MRNSQTPMISKVVFISSFLFFNVLLKTGINMDWLVFNWLSFSFKLSAKKHWRKSPCVLIYLRRIDWGNIVTRAVSSENMVPWLSSIKKALNTLPMTNAVGGITVSRSLLPKVLLAQAITSGINQWVDSNSKSLGFGLCNSLSFLFIVFAPAPSLWSSGIEVISSTWITVGS